jgi:eukaryotic-like serine/threonine-protein kinase
MPQPPHLAAQLTETLALTMHAVHKCELAHRDLKPANVLLHVEEGKVPADQQQTKSLSLLSGATVTDPPACTVKIMDFGLARRLDQDAGQTSSGDVLGTPGFMAPEQAGHAKEAGPPADVYGLGAILYYLLTGRPPFTGPSVLETLQQVKAADPLPPSRVVQSTPRDLETICLKCLEKQPARRYGSALELAEDVQRYLARKPITARPASQVERAGKWVRRNPVWTALLATAGLLLVSLGAFAIYYGHKQFQEAQDATARAKQETAHREEIQVRKQAGDRVIFAAIINQALRSWLRCQPHTTQELLDSVRPERTDGGLDYRGWEWHYLKRLCHSEKLRFQGHTGQVSCIAYSPDGTRLASGSSDGTARVWDATTGQTVHVLKGHIDTVTCLAFNPDGKLLATGSEDTTIKLWEVATGKELATLTGHILTVNSLAFPPAMKGVASPPKSHLLASAGDDGTIQLHDVATRKQVRVFQGHRTKVTCVAFSPDGTRLASAGWDFQVRLWDVAAGTELRAWEGDRHFVFFSADGSRLLFGGHNALQIVDLASGKPVRAIAVSHPQGAPVLSAEIGTLGSQTVTSYFRPVQGFTAAALSTDGCRLCTIDGGMIQIWDADTGQELRTLRLPAKSNQRDSSYVAWSPDGRQIVAGNIGSCIHAWSAQEEQEGPLLTGHHSRIERLAFNPDGSRLASTSQDHTAKIWDAATGAERVSLGQHRYIYGPATPGQPGELQKIIWGSGHQDQVRGVAFSPDGRWLATGSNDHTLRVWDAATGTETLSIPVPLHVASVAWTPDGQHLAAGSWDDKVYLFAFPSGKLVRRFEGHAEDVTEVAFSPDGKLLASAGRDQTVRIWEVATGRPLQVLEGKHLNWLQCVAFSPDGRLLAAGGQDMVITVWETATWQVQRTLWGHVSDIFDLAFSPDSRRLATAGGATSDGTVKVWDMVTGLELLSVPGGLAVRFSPDGRRLAVAQRNSRIRIYETAPVDALPYRTAPYEPPPPGGKLAADDGRLRILGHYTAPELPSYLNQGAPWKPADGKVFFVAVVSLPMRYFIPPAQAYARAQAKQQPKDEPLPVRECIALYLPFRFRLHLADAAMPKGQFFTHWPLNRTMMFMRELEITSSKRYDPQERVALVIAWSVDPKDVKWPLRIQIDKEEPVEVPNVRLVPQVSGKE